MVSGFRELDKWIKKINETHLSNELIQEISNQVRIEILKSAKSQKSPDGKNWSRTEDGKRALKNLNKHLKVSIVKDTIVIKLEGYYSRHNIGAVRGKKKRQMLPSGKIPDQITAAIKHVVESRFKNGIQ